VCTRSRHRQGPRREPAAGPSAEASDERQDGLERPIDGVDGRRLALGTEPRPLAPGECHVAADVLLEIAGPVDRAVGEGPGLVVADRAERPMVLAPALPKADGLVDDARPELGLRPRRDPRPVKVAVGEVETLRLIVYDEGAAILATQAMPDGSGPAYRAARVWVKRNGQWQMAISVHTDIKNR